MTTTPAARPRVPENRPVAVLTRPLALFAAAPASGGIVLLVAALAALGWANSPWWRSYVHLWEFRIGFGFAHFEVFHPLHFWINDGLMAIFFLLVGLEIKREIITGELASKRRAALPILAALGGVLFPALIYAAWNAKGPGQPGWGIPMATDIAFVAGILALLGSRVPAGLAVFLTALAIVDDLFAVLVIALFYTDALHWQALGWAAAVLAVLFVMNRMGVSEPLAYALPGLLLWIAVLASGIHATIAGVLLALAIPARRFLHPEEFLRRSQALLNRFAAAGGDHAEQEAAIEALEAGCRHVEPPLNRMEAGLRPWVGLAIMPLFAFANAGVRFVGEDTRRFWNPVTAGVLMGLVLGKPAGILLFSWLANRLRMADRPSGVSWAHIHGAGWLAGIGFTMSLFVGGLAFGAGKRLDDATIGVFSASVLAGAVGSFLLLRIPGEKG